MTNDTTTPGAGEELNPHDVLCMEGHLWTVTGVFLGAENQGSVIGLATAGEQHDPTAYGQNVRELFVPEILIRRALAVGLLVRHRAPTGEA